MGAASGLEAALRLQRKALAIQEATTADLHRLRILQHSPPLSSEYPSPSPKTRMTRYRSHCHQDQVSAGSVVNGSSFESAWIRGAGHRWSHEQAVPGTDIPIALQTPRRWSRARERAVRSWIAQRQERSAERDAKSREFMPSFCRWCSEGYPRH